MVLSQEAQGSLPALKGEPHHGHRSPRQSAEVRPGAAEGAAGEDGEGDAIPGRLKKKMPLASM